jgi:DNA-binding response OmpR family regulator
MNEDINTDKKKKNIVLIVDDDEFLLDMYVLKFKEAGFVVNVAQTGMDAVEKALEVKPDVILLDIVLPERDGFEVLQELRKGKQSPPPFLVMLTNLGQKDDTERSMRLGADDYIVKAHFTPSEVVEKIKKLLAKHKQ